jgi:uncharacterized protein YjbI with pentapeptide repeats
MANPEHLEILNQGVETWNQWREEHREIKPNLRGGDLDGIDLTGVNLSWADLGMIRLRGTILSGAKLSGVDLFFADLTGATLSRAKLNWALISEANLTEADLYGAEIWGARLINAKLDGAILTGAHLWETQRSGWSIAGVICEFAYWDEEAKDKSTYSPGEFEKLFADKTKVRLIYRDGISPLEIASLPALIKHLEDSHPGCGLRLVSIQEDSGGVVVELAIEDDGDQSPEQLKQLKAELEAEAQQKGQYLRQALDGTLELRGQVQAYERVVAQLLSNQKTTYYLEKGDIKMGDTYNISGQAGAVGQNASASNMTFNQIVNHFEKSIDLPALAKQLAELREEMAKRQDSSPQAIIAQGEAAKAEMAVKEGNTSKVVEYLKAGGQGLLDIAKETGKELLTAAIKTSMGMQ